MGRFPVREVGDVIIVEVEGPVDQNHEGPRILREMFEEMLLNGKVKIILNFTKAGGVDSTGITVLMRAQYRFQQRRGEIKLLNPGEKFRKLLLVIQAGDYFEISENENMLVRSFDYRSSVKKCPMNF